MGCGEVCLLWRWDLLIEPHYDDGLAIMLIASVFGQMKLAFMLKAYQVLWILE
jgi:hypothetical protein